ncbi:MAG: AraC family transcriptional regulator [Bacteroidota bacterium]
MEETNGILEKIRQHSKLTLVASSDVHRFLPTDILQKLLRPHRAACYIFVFVEKGILTQNVDMQDIQVSDGELFFVLPNQVHKPSPEKENVTYCKIAFDESTLALIPKHFSFLLNPLQNQIINFDEVVKKRIKANFVVLEELLKCESREENTEVILAHFNTLLTELNNAYFKYKGNDRLLNPRIGKYIEFKLLIESNLTDHIAVNDIAERLSLSTSSLYGIVKEFSGLSPKEFITSRLILEAQRKLCYSDPSIKELAYDLGYNDPDYFSRIFKKNTGKSVSEYLADLQDLSGY